MNLIKICRWIFSILFALALTSAVAYSLIIITDIDLRSRTMQTNGDLVIACILHIIIPLISFILLPFLTCLMAPKPKKLGAVIVAVISILLSFYITYISLKSHNSLGLANVLGLLVGLGMGFIISYNCYKEKGWNKQVTNNMPEEY